MKKRWKKPSGGTQNEESFIVCISDLMAGLLSIFLLAMVYYILNFSQATAQLTENDVKRTAILATVQNEMKEKGIEVKIDPDHGVLTLPEGVLFDVGEATVKEKGVVVISNLGQVLWHVLSKSEYVGAVETVFVEGHTDNIPINTPIFPSNWELSTQRAINTWIALNKTDFKLDSLKNKKNEILFSCSGYADTRPTHSNDSLEGRQENRRIDLRFSMTPPTKEEAKIIKTVKQKLEL